MIYKASLDTSAKVITFLMFVVILAITFQLQPEISANPTFYYAIIGLVILTIGICYLFAPTAYLLGEDALIIKRPVKNVTVKYADISEVTKISDDTFLWTFRLLGVGGLFGYYGIFYNRQIGRFHAFATKRMQNRILIYTQSGKKLMITPDDIDLYQQLEEKLGD